MFADLTGLRVGKLVALSMLPELTPWKRAQWLVQCDCGKQKVVLASNLQAGKSLSCGCVGKQKNSERLTKHGGSETNLYEVWCSMLARCGRPTAKQYANYGARGIKVCDRWKDFANFAADVGEKPSPKHSLDRINNDGDYEPSNIRWATPAEQVRNTRRNILITVNGEKRLMLDVAASNGISRGTVYHRLFHYKWTPEDAATVPLRKRSK